MLEPIQSATVVSHWTTLINLIIQNYFIPDATLCILWNEKIDFDLLSGQITPPVLSIWPKNVANYLDDNVFDIPERREDLVERGLPFDDFILEMVVAIEESYCENFIAFQEDIPLFAESFRTAAKYANWHPRRVRFLFAYRKDIARANNASYFQDNLFRDQSSILIVEAETANSTNFNLLTNKFVGPLKDNPAQLYVLNTYDGGKGEFSKPKQTLFPDKLRDLQGREYILGVFDYRPFVVLDNNTEPQFVDNAPDNEKGTIYVDGTECRLLITFCELYNCSTQVDSSVKTQWGSTYDNGTGDGIMGMVLREQSHMAVGAIYFWSEIQYVDMTVFLGRSGVSCLVPKPKRVTNWNLPLKPFQSILWIGVATCLVLESLALWATYHAEILFVLQEKDDGWSRSKTFGYTTTLKIFVSQSPSIDAISSSVRIVLFSCFMIDIIITSIYSGGLASILTLPTMAETADSAERLHKFGIPWVGNSEDWIFALKADVDPFHVELIQNYFLYDNEKITEMAKKENMGFIVERLTFGHFGNVDFITQESLEHLKMMVDDLYYQFTVALVPRLWACLMQYNNLIYAWHSSGLDKFWEWKVSANFLNENQQKQIQQSIHLAVDVGPVKLDLSNFAGLLLIWLCGIVVSILAFGGEIAYQRMQRKREMKRTLNEDFEEEI